METNAEHSRPVPFSPPSPELSLDAAGLTDVGVEREKNEDAYLIGTIHRSLLVREATAHAQGWLSGGPIGTLLVVADGMGGHPGGDVASSTAINAVADYLVSSLPWPTGAPPAEEQRDSVSGMRGRLLSAVMAGDETVKTTGAKRGTPSMGTTLTMALVVPPAVYVAHVGDTRCYWLRAGKLQRLTTDHNMAESSDPSGRYFDAPPEILQSFLWNSLGASHELPRPELVKLSLEPGDTLLLCSDGLNKHVTDERIQAALESGATSRACCAQLVQLALEGGGTDNVTALVARFGVASD